MDPGTGLAIIGTAALGGKDIIVKLLGPTADYLGEGLKNCTEKGVKNVENIFIIAQRKLGNKIENEGAVPPKVLKGILEEGYFCDDFIAAEYLGGVLASSRSGISRDDRGAVLIALLSRLSTYQIRTHYVLYHLIKTTYDGTDITPNTSEGRDKLGLCVPGSTYEAAMDFSENEDVNILLSHIMFGLAKEGLIENNFSIGSKESLQKIFKNAPTEGIIFQPSMLGIELFLWAYGKSDLTNKDFFQSNNNFEVDSNIKILDGGIKTKE